ncbi:MAG: tetratricopeptide repeat protein [Isosphaeraceae bacterium]|nr:tetratricopeptide repeat protein [Isosphaeraceae bacterium]
MTVSARALLALACVTALGAAPTAALAQKVDEWTDPSAVAGQLLVGQRVVTKYKVPLRERDRVVDDGLAFRVYTVDRARGSRVRLTAGPVSGWVEAAQVVPFDEAVAFYTQEILKQPFPVAALNHRALIWMEKKEYDFAIADYDAAIRLNPANASAYNNRGNVYRVKKNYDRALADFDEAIRLDPTVPLHYMNRAAVWVAKKEFDKAIADHGTVIALKPRLPSAYMNRGHAWMAKKEFDKALADYDKAVKLDPGLALGYMNRGHARMAKKEFDKALADFNEAVRLAPKFALAYGNRGNAWRATKKYAKALADFDEAIRLDPDLSLTHNNRAWLLATCPDAAFRDGKSAVESAQRACGLDDWKNPTSLDTLAASYAESGDFAAAVEWQEKANSLFTDDAQRKEADVRLGLYRRHTPCRE